MQTGNRREMQHARLSQLSEITYDSDGLESPDIRRQVCEILEGAEAAFKERAKR
jgi:hypothetical protein